MPVFFQVLSEFALLVLVTLGAGGTIYKIVAPDGWLAWLFGRSLSGSAAALTALVAIAVLAWFSRDWATPRQRNHAATLSFYVLAGAGLVYLAQLWLKGAI